MRQPRAWCTQVCSAGKDPRWRSIPHEKGTNGTLSDERPAGCFRRAVRSSSGGVPPPQSSAYWTSFVTTGDWLTRYVAFPANTVRKLQMPSTDVEIEVEYAPVDAEVVTVRYVVHAVLPGR